MPKKIFTFFISILAMLSADPFMVLANTTDIDDKLIATKTATQILDENGNKIVGQYDVKINVPGKDGIDRHDEVIMMVDGSYSLDEEWPAMKETIIKIGASFLNGVGNTQLTLMAFGMGDNEVLTHVKEVQELESALGELPGTLLYGRSSTNCEAGFTGVMEYIENHDETLNEVYVIYISDGRINTDETPHNFYNWRENSWLRFSEKVIIQEAINYEINYIKNGGNKSEAFITVFGEDANLDTVLDTATDEQLNKWADLVWDAVYENAGLDKEKEYPVSDAERAFIDYDNKYDTYIQNIFYYALLGRTYPNSWTRTPKAGNELAAMEEVNKLYMVDYDNYSSWMDTGITAENSEFIKSDGITGLLTALEGVITNLSKTSYSNVVITDYTSKWVTPLDVNNDGVFDEKDIIVTNKGEVIDNANIIVRNLTALTEEELATLTETEQQEIMEVLTNDENLKNNTNNSIYQIKWYVQEGMLHSYDQYELSYKVKVDTQEEGYIGNKEINELIYNANGEINLIYDKTDVPEGSLETVTKPEEGIVKKDDEVYQKENVITITKTDEDGNLLAGADFAISSEDIGNNNVLKEYSKDGINWTTDNKNNDAIYFRFSGLYDYIYTLTEIITPDNYKKLDDIIYDFTNLEGQYINENIINESIKGNVIIHYVIKVGDKYIPLEVYAKDDEGNILSGFENIDLEDITLVGMVGTEFETIFKEINGYNFNGIYIGNLYEDSTVLEKIKGTSVKDKFTNGTIEYTYVYEIETGIGSDIPPKTGVEAPVNYNNYLTILIMGLLVIIKKLI